MQAIHTTEGSSTESLIRDHSQISDPETESEPEQAEEEGEECSICDLQFSLVYTLCCNVVKLFLLCVSYLSVPTYGFGVTECFVNKQYCILCMLIIITAKLFY